MTAQQNCWNAFNRIRTLEIISRTFRRSPIQNKGQGRHGYRDTGTPGYKASVDYVAGLMRQAGYHVTIQTYQLTASQVARMPRLAEQDMRGKAVVDYSLIAESPFRRSQAHRGGGCAS